jgi:YHS domain-containing protein
MLIKRTMLYVLALATAMIFAAPAFAADPVYTNWLGKAIAGYDPVSYHTMGKPVEGNSDFKTKWKGATWYFASAENRDKFTAMPEKFAPQYGGYCAYAVSQNSTAKIDPEMWTIVDGKLYLNYSEGIQERWLADQTAFITAADKNWPGVLN